MKSAKKLLDRRTMRNRSQLRRKSAGRARLSVFRSGRHIYAQVIDDVKGHTVAAASTMEKDLKAKSGANTDAASLVGKLLAERALKAGINEVVFDRGGYRYHGRVKALADGAREAGLAF